MVPLWDVATVCDDNDAAAMRRSQMAFGKTNVSESDAVS
jgi:hypothetical protein